MFGILAVSGCLIDLLTKSWAFARLGHFQVQQGNPTPPIWLWDGIFGFETGLNEGALWGIGQGQVLAFSTLSFVALAGVLYWLFWAGAASDLYTTIALGMVSGGIVGNLYDRLGFPGLTWAEGARHHSAGDRVYAVRDWIHFKIDAIGFDYPIFNIADCLLVCGAILLVWRAFRHND
jgi:signal peptidase II